MERILNKVAKSVKIFSLIGAAMGVTFILLGIVGVSIDGGAQAPSFVSRSAGTSLGHAINFLFIAECSCH